MRSSHTHTTDQHEKLSFQEIYGAISKQAALTRDELKFLRRIIQRRLRDVTRHLNKETDIFRPYSDLYDM